MAATPPKQIRFALGACGGLRRILMPSVANPDLAAAPDRPVGPAHIVDQAHHFQGLA
jgi:hypothetical protein